MGHGHYAAAGCSVGTRNRKENLSLKSGWWLQDIGVLKNSGRRTLYLSLLFTYPCY